MNMHIIDKANPQSGLCTYVHFTATCAATRSEGQLMWLIPGKPLEFEGLKISKIAILAQFGSNYADYSRLIAGNPFEWTIPKKLGIGIGLVWFKGFENFENCPFFNRKFQKKISIYFSRSLKFFWEIFEKN